jgi:hypothetical protein
MAERRIGKAKAIGRIKENKVMCARSAADAGDWALPHIAGGAHGGEIGADGLHGGGVIIDEAGRAGAARQRFDPQCAGAGEQVEHVQVFKGAEPAGEHRKDCFAGAVAGRPGRFPGGGFQGAASGSMQCTGFQGAGFPGAGFQGAGALGGPPRGLEMASHPSLLPSMGILQTLGTTLAAGQQTLGTTLGTGQQTLGTTRADAGQGSAHHSARVTGGVHGPLVHEGHFEVATARWATARWAKPRGNRHRHDRYSTAAEPQVCSLSF